MTMLELWHDELRRRGMTREYIARRDARSDRGEPRGALLMREEIPEKLVPLMRLVVEALAEQEVGSELRKYN